MTLNACHHRTRVGINECVLGLYYSSLNHERNKNKYIAIFMPMISWKALLLVISIWNCLLKLMNTYFQLL